MEARFDWISALSLSLTLATPRHGGSTIWESVKVSCLRSPGGEITNYLCLREDVSDRKKLELELSGLPIEPSTSPRNRPLAFLPWQLVGPLMLAAVGIKLTVLMPLWHSCLDRT